MIEVAELTPETFFTGGKLVIENMKIPNSTREMLILSRSTRELLINPPSTRELFLSLFYYWPHYWTSRLQVKFGVPCFMIIISRWEPNDSDGPKMVYL